MLSRIVVGTKIGIIPLIPSLSHWIAAKGTVHLSYNFRGRESGESPEKAATKGKKRRTDDFRDKVDAAKTTAVIELILHPGALVQG